MLVYGFVNLFFIHLKKKLENKQKIGANCVRTSKILILIRSSLQATQFDKRDTHTHQIYNKQAIKQTHTHKRADLNHSY